MNRRQIAFLSIFIGGIIIDQLIKYWVRHSLVQHQSMNAPFPGFFEITLTYNQGVAFGMAQGLGKFTVPIAGIMSIFATFMSFKNPKDPLISHVAMGCIASGALGNAIDRLFSEKVTDMFWFRAINFPVFNFADVLITIAGFLLVLGWGLEIVRGKGDAMTETLPPSEPLS